MALVEDEAMGVNFTRQYMEENCGFNGLRVSDLSTILDIDEKQLSYIVIQKNL